MSLSSFLTLKASYSGLFFSKPMKSLSVKDGTIHTTEWHEGNFEKNYILLYLRKSCKYKKLVEKKYRFFFFPL